MQPDGDLLLICHFESKIFGFGGRPQEAIYISRDDVEVWDEGKHWIGKDVKANLSIGGAENKIHLKPEMLVRLEALLDGVTATV